MTPKSLLNRKKLLLLPVAVLLALAVRGQAPPVTFQCYITNQVLISPTVYQFDVYLLNTSTASTDTFRYAQGQWGITVNSNIANGGSLTPSVVAGSSQLTLVSQRPTTVTL